MRAVWLEFETIRKLFRRRKMAKSKQHGNQLLTDSEELGLVAVVETFSLIGTLLSRQEVIMATRETKNLPEIWDGRDWLGGFFVGTLVS